MLHGEARPSGMNLIAPVAMIKMLWRAVGSDDGRLASAERYWVIQKDGSGRVTISINLNDINHSGLCSESNCALVPLEIVVGSEKNQGG